MIMSFDLKQYFLSKHANLISNKPFVSFDDNAE